MDIQATETAQFMLTTRAFTADSILVPATVARPVTWMLPVTDVLLAGEQTGPDAWFTATAPGTVSLRATRDLGVDITSVTVHGPTVELSPSATPVDWILAYHTPGSAPALGVIRGLRAGTPVVDDVVAFAGAARLDDLTDGGSLAVFRAGQRASLLTGIWTAKADTAALDPSGPWPVAVKIWNATHDSAPISPTDDLRIAGLVFAGNRTGITFNLMNPVVRLAEMKPDTSDCNAPESLLGPDYEPGVPMLHVIYFETVQNGGHGYACGERANQQARAIFIARSRNATTLAHELGHTFALLDPGGYHGHTDCVAGFDHDNVMWRFLPDNQQSNRLHFSLGQVYRITMDPRSWLAKLGWSPGPTAPTCAADGYACPALPLPTVAPDPWTPPVYCGPP